ncbi:MAG: YqhV family protein [Firmicutes bacterium]|nr:YqhV family protein [Bacillota bacterium]
MALVRVLSASIELTGAYLIYRVAKVEHALRVNAVLGMVGPTILIIVTLLGISGLAGRIPPGKLLLLLSGVVLIFAGTSR